MKKGKTIDYGTIFYKTQIVGFSESFDNSILTPNTSYKKPQHEDLVGPTKRKIPCKNPYYVSIPFLGENIESASLPASKGIY